MPLESPLMPLYARSSTAFSHGDGAWIWDTHGQRYLDFLVGIAVVSLGHNHPRITATIQEQASKLMQVSNGYTIDEQTHCAQQLVEHSGMDNVYFCNCGAEANETALKIARRYGHDQGISSPVVITIEGSFHGRTFACISAADNPKIKKNFDPLLPGFLHVPLNDIAAVEQLAAEHNNIAAVLIEPILGEGGILPAEHSYLQALRALCDRQGWLLMFDEVQTGVARTGTFFAFQHAGILPDVVSSAKALGNGYPVGATLARGQAAQTLKVGDHGCTYGGNPLACKVVSTVIDVIDDDQLCDNAQRMGAYLKDSLHSQFHNHPGMVDLRGEGLMLGLELDRPCTAIREIGLQNGILFSVTAQNTIRMVPPLIINEEQVDFFVEKLHSSVKAFYQNEKQKATSDA